MGAIQFDLKIDPQNVTWPDYLAGAIAADKLAFGTFWTWDHLLPISGDMDASNHESYTLLAGLAVATQRIRLGAHVTGVMYRNPALQIKMATELDVMSNGRLDFGIGAAWAEREFRAFNIPFPPASERIAALRETLDLAKLLWSGEPRKKITFNGKFVQATDLFLNPQPIQRPHPPIMIGGGGEQLTLRVVARHADIWHGFGDVATLKRKIDLIHGYAPDYSRDGRDIVNCCDASIWVGDMPDATAERLAQLSRRPVDQVRAGYFQGTPAEIEAKLRPLIDIGITRFIVSAGSHDLVDNWKRVSEQIIPRFANG